MRNFVISAAIIALIGGTTLAIAQDRSRDGGERGGGQHVGGPREGGGENKGARPAPQAAPRAAPNPGAMNGRNAIGERQFREHHDVPSPARAAAPAPNAVGGNNFSRDGHDLGRDRRDNNSRGNNGFRDNSGPGPNFNRSDRPNNAMRDNRGPRRDFSNFRNYHQNFRAPRRFRAPTYRRPPGFYARRWNWGETLPISFWARDYWLTDFYAYDLPPPPYGAVWVRVGEDALLIDQDTGEIIEVDYGVFY
jgi:Ni/Co efflux regulator RcnB